jgi:hypothetical protein
MKEENYPWKCSKTIMNCETLNKQPLKAEIASISYTISWMFIRLLFTRTLLSDILFLAKNKTIQYKAT